MRKTSTVEIQNIWWDLGRHKPSNYVNIVQKLKGFSPYRKKAIINWISPHVFHFSNGKLFPVYKQEYQKQQNILVTVVNNAQVSIV